MDAVSGTTQDGSRSHQQVMSAQEAQPTAQLNGTTGPQSSGGGYGATAEVAPRAVGTMAGHDPVVTEGLQPLDAPAGSAFRPPASMEATTSQIQVEATRPPTISDLGGRPGMGIEAESQSAAATHDFFTPRSRGPGPPGQNAWMGMMEGLPRWMNRLSSCLALLTGETPPGGRSFVLRSPQRARPIVIPRPSTPPSSSVPAEAIQQEVQRQLSGIRLLLEDSENRNYHLQREIEELRRSQSTAAAAHTLAPDLGGATVSQGGRVGHSSLLGDPATAPLGSGGQCSHGSLLGDLAAAPSGPGRQCGHGSLLGDLAAAPSGPGGQCGHSGLLGDPATTPPGLGGQQSYSAIPSDPLTALQGPRGHQGQDGALTGQSTFYGVSLETRPTTSIPPHPEQPPEPRGLLRSLLGGARPRTPSPPPQSTAPQPESSMINP